MLNLPKVTEVNRFLPKKSIYSKFNVDSRDRDLFDANIKRLSISNEISASNINVSSGKSIFVVHVLLKKMDFDVRIISRLSKWIDQRILFVLEYEDKFRLGVNYTKLLFSDWCDSDNFTIDLVGLSMDDVWDNVVVQVGNLNIGNGLSLEEQIVLDDRKQRLEKQIVSLEKQARSERQPKKKLELVKKIKLLEKEIEQ